MMTVCMWTFGGEGLSLDGYLHKYGDFIYLLLMPPMFALSDCFLFSKCNTVGLIGRLIDDITV